MTTVSPNTIATTSFDHVALWVADREPLTELLCERLGMHVIERSDEFTLVGADAREGKLTLFEAPGPREAGVLKRVVLRVRDLGEATRRLDGSFGLASRDGVASLDAPEGLRLGLVEADGIDYDLDHVVLRVPDTEATARRLAELGFERRGEDLDVADRSLRLEPGDHDGEPERPLLNHLALLVDSAGELRRAAEARGIEVEKVVDAENTLAVFLRGPDGILLEYVEHKPGFSLT